MRTDFKPPNLDEFQAAGNIYAMVAVLAVLNAFKHKWFLLLFLGTCVVLFLAYPETIAPLYPRSDAYMTPRLIGCFFLGIVFYVFRSEIYLSSYIGLALIALCWVSWTTAFFGFAFYGAFAYWTLFIAFLPANYLSRFFDRVDLSYGVYIFGFPIQQLVVSFYTPISPTKLFLLSYPVAVLLALFSWYMVEAKALRLKGRLSFPRYGTTLKSSSASSY